QPGPAKYPRLGNHYMEWIDACKGGAPAMSNFIDYAGKLTEVVLVGNVAMRVGKKIEWDGPNMKAPNCPEADRFIKNEYRAGWELASL
ncbi:gfo/Idh/MocA family oxidoreductase, partial [Candidatus Sumerlaeota bacterium]|nr:gfo/Idh/MocA family oxidoreductase [Candidatus Sumerlaeota bacterium]